VGRTQRSWSLRRTRKRWFVPHPERGFNPRLLADHSQGKPWSVAPGSSKQKPIRYQLGSAAPLCAAQHWAEFL